MPGFGTIGRGQLGISQPDKAFKRFYTNYGFPTIVDGGASATPPINNVLKDPVVRERFKGWATANIAALGKVAHENDVEGARSVLKNWLDSKPDNVWDNAGRKAILGDHSNATPAHTRATTDSSVVGVPSADGAVPLVYDPDIIELKKQVTPILDQITTRGQAGFKAVANRIDQASPIGFTTEADSADLSDNTASNSSYTQVEKDMEIMVDLLEVTDFAQMGTEFQFDLRNSQLGQRIAALMQLKERTVLYGDNSLAAATGDFDDADAYDGIEADIENNFSANHVDKSAVSIDGTLALTKDIKAEIKERLQSDDAVTPDNLFIGTSYTLHDAVENEVQNFVRVGQVDGTNVGGSNLMINGVEMIASHNVDQHNSGSNTAGDEGDVFILDRRSVEYRELMPLSTVPLARQGFAERVALGEFGAPILRADGQFSKYLSAYSLTQLT